ncbi:MAG: hypothetical protein ACYC1F_05450 [Gallionellaceae bacterium]
MRTIKGVMWGFLMLAIAVVPIGAQAASNTANSSKPFDCNPYPQVDATDFDVGGKIGVAGLRKLASGEVDANFRTETKKLLSDHPDANKALVMMGLLAYNCRAIQEEQTTPDEKRKARERFTLNALNALYPSPSPRAPVAAPQRMSDQSKKSWDLPSVRLAAKKLSLAASKFRGALATTYEAALGGSYLPVIPYELMLDEFMLRSATKQDMMHSVPNTVTYPEDAATSLGFDVCVGIRSGNQLIDQTLSLYAAKMPEILFGDLEQIKETRVYEYFSAYGDRDDCKAFLGRMKAERDQEANKPIEPGKLHFVVMPGTPPEFSNQELKSYLLAVKRLEDHLSLMAKPKADVR